MLARDGVQNARVQLYPEHLGQVDVRIRIDDDGTWIHMHAHTSHGRDALDGSLHRLRELCADQGMNLADANVTFGDERSPQQNSRDRAQPSALPRGWSESTVDAEPVPERTAHSAATARLVDLLA